MQLMLQLFCLWKYWPPSTLSQILECPPTPIQPQPEKLLSHSYDQPPSRTSWSRATLARLASQPKLVTRALSVTMPSPLAMETVFCLSTPDLHLHLFCSLKYCYLIKAHFSRYRLKQTTLWRTRLRAAFLQSYTAPVQDICHCPRGLRWTRFPRLSAFWLHATDHPL